MSNAKIQRLREKGRWSFIIKYGVLIWGLGSSLLVSIAIPLVTEVEYNFTQLLAISLPILCAGGILLAISCGASLLHTTRIPMPNKAVLDKRLPALSLSDIRSYHLYPTVESPPPVAGVRP